MVELTGDKNIVEDMDLPYAIIQAGWWEEQKSFYAGYTDKEREQVGVSYIDRLNGLMEILETNKDRPYCRTELGRTCILGTLTGEMKISIQNTAHDMFRRTTVGIGSTPMVKFQRKPSLDRGKPGLIKATEMEGPLWLSHYEASGLVITDPEVAGSDLLNLKVGRSALIIGEEATSAYFAMLSRAEV